MLRAANEPDFRRSEIDHKSPGVISVDKASLRAFGAEVAGERELIRLE
jgi:hypothetical protein